MYLFNVIMNGCLLAINDLRILQLLDRNLQLFGCLSLLFYLDVLECFQIIICNDFFTPATRIGNETLHNELTMTLPTWF